MKHIEETEPSIRAARRKEKSQRSSARIAPKVRTSHHRNKEEAARLQELVNKRFAVSDTSTDRSGK